MKCYLVRGENANGMPFYWRKLFDWNLDALMPEDREAIDNWQAARKGK